jgi:hypothetical protein
VVSPSALIRIVVDSSATVVLVMGCAPLAE